MTEEIILKEVSPSMSIKGYKFSVWWSKNKETIKTLLSAGVAIVLFFLPQIKDVSASAAVGVMGGAIAKLLFDTLDFYFNEVKLN